jgi:acyl-CoA thioesterase II
MSATAIMALIDPQPTEAPNHWQMTAHRNLCLGPAGSKHISGGASLASVVETMERATGRPLIQAHAQFLAVPAAGTDFVIDLRCINQGRSITQVQAAIIADDADRAIIAATLGARGDSGSFTWERAEPPCRPDTAPPVPFVRLDDGDLHSRLDMRLALDPRYNPTGRAMFWVRAPDASPVPAAFLALIADYLPEAIHMNIGRPAGAVSLDNSIRIIRRVATPWLLCDIQLSAIADGLFHGRMAIFTEDGALVATASQSGVVRLFNS